MTIVGHETIIELLHRSVASSHLHHALLFRGPDGVGKRAVALDLAMRLICENPQQRHCGVCRNCQRIARPFPQHPDVTIYRDLQEPFFITREQIIALCKESGVQISEHEDKLPDIWKTTIDTLLSDGIFKHYSESPVAGSFLVTLRLDTAKKITRSVIEKSSHSPLRYNLLKQIGGFIETGGYEGTLKIEQIRQLQHAISFHPFESRVKIIIIDNAHNMLPPAQNCLLKTLEEPPGESQLILITSQPHMLLPTIRSRCQIVPFHTLPRTAIHQCLMTTFKLSDEMATQIADQSEGSMNLALSRDWPAFFDQCRELDQMFEMAQTEMGEIEWTLALLARILPDDDRIEVKNRLDDFSRYLRILLTRTIDIQTAASDYYVLPGGRCVTPQTIIDLIDGVSAIRKSGRFHIDSRLHLQRLLFETLNKRDFN